LVLSDFYLFNKGENQKEKTETERENRKRKRKRKRKKKQKEKKNENLTSFSVNHSSSATHQGLTQRRQPAFALSWRLRVKRARTFYHAASQKKNLHSNQN